MKASTTNVVITGVGGQGNVLAARLLATAALEQGLEVTVGDVYGLTQRGGSVASHVRWTKGRPLPPLVPRGALDILVAFEPLEALRIQGQFGHLRTAALVNTAPVMPIGVQAGRFPYPDTDELWALLERMTGRCLGIEGSEAARSLGNIQALNTVMLGALCASGLTGFEADLFTRTIQNELPARFVDLNLEAFERGLALGRETGAGA
jgi:indolepyruvate ferredoxin oxidoreductase beta subunit